MNFSHTFRVDPTRRARRSPILAVSFSRAGRKQDRRLHNAFDAMHPV
jgi:hypothetical protein